MESELRVRSGHSCQDQPAIIEGAQRIFHERWETLPATGTPPLAQSQAGNRVKL